MPLTTSKCTVSCSIQDLTRYTNYRVMRIAGCEPRLLAAISYMSVGVRRQFSAACRLTHDNPTEEVNRLGFLTPLTDLQDAPLPSRRKALCRAPGSGLLESASLGEPHPLQISAHPQLQGLQDSMAVGGHYAHGKVYWGPPTVYDEPNEPRAYSHRISTLSERASSVSCNSCFRSNLLQV